MIIPKQEILFILPRVVLYTAVSVVTVKAVQSSLRQVRSWLS